MQIKEHYRIDLNKERKDIQVYILDFEHKKKSGKDPLNEAQQKVIELWKELIREAIEGLLKSIDNRKTRGAEFSTIKAELEQMLEELPYTTAAISTLESTYDQTLRQRRQEIKEKIEIERYNNRRFWLGLGIGFIAGIIATIITSRF
jgi:hypothetical protein